MAKPKKTQANTATAAVRAMIAAAQPLPPIPSHVRLRDADKPFWEAIMRARTRDEWTDADLIAAAQLARCQSDIEAESLALEAEGSVIENQRGTQIMNPRHSVLEQLSRRQLALMRSLRISGSSTGDRKEDLVKARNLQRQAERALAEVADDDELLAT
jgi:hypothetical protein